MNAFLKNKLHEAWEIALYWHVKLTAKPRKITRNPRIFYGGARSGNLGGPLVKIKRLNKYFPQCFINYNIAYLLSNTPYLSEYSLKQLILNKIPIVLNQNGVFYSGWYDGNWQKRNSDMAKAYHLADYVFWQSDFCRRSANKFLGYRDGPGEILFNAVDTKLFYPAPVKIERPFTFLLTGSIGKKLAYRIETTIHGLALARYSGLNAKLIIAGWIEDISPIQDLIRRLGLTEDVKILGAYTAQQAPSIYQSADAYVMTKYLDPCPNTVIEALSCGLPILYSASGGLPELVDVVSGIGLSVPEDWNHIHTPSIDAIAKGMIEIAENSVQMSIAARDLAKSKYDIKHWIERHQLVFNNLIGK